MYPLLNYATNLSNPEAEVLVEEALKCWGVALAVEPSVAPQLVGLLPNMSQLLKRGKDNSAAFQILEAYLLLQVGARAVHFNCSLIRLYVGIGTVHVQNTAG
eukprot:GHRR01031307.1.p2 GENE.GHRR01031307.1~~GHRR01031307.1.p2  ORF type:complete len:102 (+),score=19.17 GHRR01031307.1:234-539(+)